MRGTMFVYGTAAGAIFLLLPFFAHAQKEYAVHMNQNTFQPSRIEIEQGETVVFINDDASPHWVASNVHPTHTLYPNSDIRSCGTEDEAQIFDSCRGLEKDEEYRFTFTKVGAWGFHDHLNPTMTGSIVVRSSSPTDASEQEGSRELSFVKKLQARLLGGWYHLFSEAGEERLREINLVQVTKRDDDLEFWMRVFGYHAIFDALEVDANDPLKQTDKKNANLQAGECHTEAHFAGRMAYKLYGISALNENILDTRCAFGFYHGIIEMSLGGSGTDETIRAFVEKCEAYGDDFLRTTFCMHAVGHGLMVYYGSDLPRVIQKCSELIEPLAGKRMCYHGAFMENSFEALGIGISGHSTSWIDPKDPDFHCTSTAIVQDSHVQEMCYVGQSLIWGRSKNRFDEEKAIAGCERVPIDARKMCFTGIGFNIAFPLGSGTLGNDEIVRRCGTSPTSDDKENCISGALFMRSTHWWTFVGFKDPVFCSALGKNDPEECDKFVREKFSWLKLEQPAR